ncbi:ABC transporter substrate-binding protein [Nostoc sp. CHAB 5824]|nr:ABC transporter substrate-binding protein [Nostoc sp. CHAB 5824]
MNPSSPSSTAVPRLSCRNFIQYCSIWIGSSFIAGCTNSNQPPTSNSRLDKVTFGTNWIAQAEHGGFYQAVATGIYKDYGLDVTIKMGGPQVPSGTQLLMGGAVDFFMGYGMDAVNTIAQGIPKIIVAQFSRKTPGVLLHIPTQQLKPLPTSL